MKRPLVEAAVNNNHIQNDTRAAFKSVTSKELGVSRAGISHFQSVTNAACPKLDMAGLCRV